MKHTPTYLNTPVVMIQALAMQEPFKVNGVVTAIRAKQG